MILSQLLPDIRNLVNNSSLSADVITNWCNAALNEIGRQGGWSFLIADKQANMNITNKYLPLPQVYTTSTTTIDMDMLIEPLYLSTSATQLTATTTWNTPSAMWEFEKQNQLFTHNDDFRISQLLGLEFNSRWNTTTSVIWARYYRKIVTLASSSDTTAFDLPDQFVYRLMTFGPARYGLIQEDDYERLQVCNAEFQKTITDMRHWDNKRFSANGITMLKSHSFGNYSTGPTLPANYSA